MNPFITHTRYWWQPEEKQMPLSTDINDILDDCSMHYMRKIQLRDIAESVEALETELIEERASYESQIQRMKCCGNCQHYTNEKCVTCKRSWANMIEDNWQLKQSDDGNE